MPVLLFWKCFNYLKDIQSGPDYLLNQDSKSMSNIKPGENIWGLTRRRAKTYVIASDLVVVSTRKTEKMIPDINMENIRGRVISKVTEIITSPKVPIPRLLFTQCAI